MYFIYYLITTLMPIILRIGMKKYKYFFIIGITLFYLLHIFVWANVRRTREDNIYIIITSIIGTLLGNYISNTMI